VATKKRRRKQLARSSLQRHEVRRQQREARRRRFRLVATAVLVGLLLGALVIWILVRSMAGSDTGAVAVASSHYHWSPSPPLNAEVTR
jgi:uncharacterized membrane protein